MPRLHAAACGVFLLASALGAAASAADGKSKVIDDPAYTRPQRLVEVEPGRKLNLYCVGKGSPTVIFESGLTDDMAVWGMVQREIGQHTRACAYDRAGVGFSDPARRASDSANIVDDLHRLLAAASIKAFVGEDYAVSHVPPQAQAVLKRFDERAAHFEVIDRREQLG